MSCPQRRKVRKTDQPAVSSSAREVVLPVNGVARLGCLPAARYASPLLSLRRSARLDGKATKYLSPEVTSEMGSSSGDDVVEVEKSHSSSNKDKTCRTKSAKRERKQMKKESRKTRKKQRKKTKTKRRKRKALSSESSTTFSSCGFLRGTCSSAVA